MPCVAFSAARVGEFPKCARENGLQSEGIYPAFHEKMAFLRSWVEKARNYWACQIFHFGMLGAKVEKLELVENLNRGTPFFSCEDGFF